MERIASDYGSLFQIEVLSGGMILPADPVPIRVMAPLIQEFYPVVEKKTGVRFGSDFLWHIQQAEESDWFPSSELPAIALNVFKSFLPDQQVELAASIQQSLFQEGRDLTDSEAYRHLVHQYKLPVDEFYSRLKNPEYKQLAYEEFETCRHLKVTGYPQLFCQLSESRILRISSGYTELNLIQNNIQEILNTINSKPESYSSL